MEFTPNYLNKLSQTCCRFYLLISNLPYVEACCVSPSTGFNIRSARSPKSQISLAKIRHKRSRIKSAASAESPSSAILVKHPIMPSLICDNGPKYVGNGAALGNGTAPEEWDPRTPDPARPAGPSALASPRPCPKEPRAQNSLQVFTESVNTDLSLLAS